ncbi:hypothetical protein [Bacillus velezensis]|nr:hypothetical protein [Bacillus velezensis]
MSEVMTGRRERDMGLYEGGKRVMGRKNRNGKREKMMLVGVFWVGCGGG